MLRRTPRLSSAVLTVLAVSLSSFAALTSVGIASATTSNLVRIGTASYPLAGTNIARAADALVLYTRSSAQLSTPTNQWGAEVTLLQGRVTALSDRQSTGAPATAIPVGTSVLSGHGAARSWLLANAHLGSTVTLPGSTPVPVPVATVPLAGPVRIGAATFIVAGVNIDRAADTLVAYTRTSTQTTSPANIWGTEITVSNGKITALDDQLTTADPGMTIPVGGYVLSGHGLASDWLLANATVGATVTPTSSTTPTASPTPLPTPSPTATPAPVPTPTAVPAPVPAPTMGNLPAKVVGGYFTTWEARNGVTLRSIVDSTNYNLIYVAFAIGVNATSGALTLDLPPGAGSPAEMKSQIAYANSKGKKVIVSVGGYYDLPGQTSGYRLDSTSKVDQLMTSMRDYQSTWGFNGMDWDLEHGNRTDNPGIIAASQRMRAEFGPTFIICFAPGVNLASWVGPGGVLDTLGAAGWDAVGEQIYDQGLSQIDYQNLIVSRMSALAGKYGATKVLLGNKYKNDDGTSLANPNGNFVDLTTTKTALSILRSTGINIRGAFHWTIQSDSDVGPYTWAGPGGIGGDILSHP